MKRNRAWALVAMGLIVWVGTYQYQRTGDQLQRLEAVGFSVDLRIENSPLLVVDSGRLEGALVYPDRYQRFALSQIKNLTWVPVAGPSREPHPELLIEFKEGVIPALRIADAQQNLRAVFEQLRQVYAAAGHEGKNR